MPQADEHITPTHCIQPITKVEQYSQQKDINQWIASGRPANSTENNSNRNSIRYELFIHSVISNLRACRAAWSVPYLLKKMFILIGAKPLRQLSPPPVSLMFLLCHQSYGCPTARLINWLTGCFAIRPPLCVRHTRTERMAVKVTDWLVCGL